MKVLVIGAGSAGRRHMENLRTLVPGVQFILAQRRPTEAVSEFAAVSVETVSRGVELCPDFAVVSNPSSLHMASLKPLAEAGIPFYVEKPLTTSEEGLDELLSIVSRNRLVTMVGYNLRFLPSLVLLKEMLRNGLCGRPVRAHFEAGQWLPDWRPAANYRNSYSASKMLGGGVLFDLSHEVDLARWFFGEFSVACAQLGSWGGLGIETEDVAGILFSRDGGPLVSVVLDYVSRPPLRVYRFVGSNGTIEWNLEQKSLRLFEPSRGWRSYAENPSDFAIGQTYAASMRHFLDCVREQRQTDQPFAEGVATVRLLLKAHASTAQAGA